MTETRPPGICAEDEQFASLLLANPEFSPHEKNYEAFVNFNLSAVERGEKVVSDLADFKSTVGASVIDIGAGSGGLSIAFAKSGADRVVAIEPDQRRFHWLQARTLGHGVNVEAIQATAERLDAPDASMDFALMDSVIEHVQQPSAVVHEVSRVLKPGGVLYLVSPNKWSVLNIVRDPHYGMFGVALMPAWLGRFYVERVRKSDRPYWVNVIPSRRWLKRNFRRDRVKLILREPEGLDKLDHPGSIRRHRAIRALARLSKATGATRLLRRIAIAQSPTNVYVGLKQTR